MPMRSSRSFRRTLPPRIAKGEKWGETYADAHETLRDGSSVIPSVDETIVWANGLIARIDAAK